MIKKILLLGLFLLFSSLFVLNSPAQAADSSKKPFLYVFVSSKNITDLETVTITALSATPAGEPVDSLSLTINGQKETCKLAFFCQKTFGPFEVAKTKWLKYEAVSIKKSGNNSESRTTKTGYILVKPVKKTTAPSFTKITTSGHQLEIGDTFDLKIFTKDQAGIAKIEIFLDGDLENICENETECGTTFGPFAEENIGEHKYEFLVTNILGNSIKPWGKFWVKGLPETSGAPQPATPAEPAQPTSGGGSSQPATPATPASPFQPQSADKTSPKIYVSADKSEALSTDLITFTAFAEDNQKVAKMNILVNAYEVKICENTTTCTYTGGPYPNYAGTSVAYGANAYDEAGNRGWTGYQGVKIIKSSQQPVLIEPSIKISASKNTLTNLETVTFTAVVEAGSKKLSDLTIYKDGTTLFSCTASPCSFVAGPFKDSPTEKFPFQVTYYAAASFSDSTNKKTDYQYITVNSASIPDTLKPVISVSGKLTNQATDGSYWSEISTKTTDESGKIAKVNIYLSEVTAAIGNPIAVCASLTSPAVCNTTHGSLLNGKRYAYWAEAYDEVGNKIISTMYYFDVPAAAVSPSPTPTTSTSTTSVSEPSISIVEFSPLPPGNKVRLDAVADAANKTISRINMLVNAVSVKDCYNTTKCSYDTPELYSSITYAATAYFTDGTWKTTGYKTLVIK